MNKSSQPDKTVDTITIDVFLSHSSDDKPFAKRLKASLEAEELSVWLDEDSILEGADLWKEIESNIEAADTFAFLISPTSIAKAARIGEYAGCRHELEYAADRGKRLLPILLCDAFVSREDAIAKLNVEIPAHQILKRNLWPQFSELEFEASFDRLLETIQRDSEYTNYTNQHTRYSQFSKLWVSRGKQDDYLILKGEALIEAEKWLEKAKTVEFTIQQDRQDYNSRPIREHSHFIEQCRVREDALRLSSRILGGTFVGSLIIVFFAGFAAWYYGNQAAQSSGQQQEAVLGTRLERIGVAALDQFKGDQTEGLLTAMRAVSELVTYEKQGRTPDQYPAASPLLALQMNLDQIRETRFPVSETFAAFKFSPDGKMFVIYNGKSFDLWDLHGRKVAHLTEGNGLISFSPDGKLIATADRKGTLMLWDLTGKEIIQFKGLQKDINVIQFSPDGKIVATGGHDGTVILSDLNGQKLTQFMGHRKIANNVDRVETGFTTIQFSPDGNMMLTAGEGGAWLRDLNGKEITQLKGDQGGVYAQFSPDGKTVVTAGEDGASIWDLNGRKLVQLERNPYIRQVNFSLDGKTIASGHDVATLWDLNGKKISELTGGEDVQFSPDGKVGVLTEDNGIPQFFDLNGRKIISNPINVSRQNANKIDDLRYLNRKKIRSLTVSNPVGGGNEFSFSPDGKSITTLAGDGTIRLWDLSQEEIIEFKGDLKSISAIQLSPDRKKIAIGGSNGNLQLWDLNGKQIAQFKGGQASVMSIRFSPDGNSITANGKLWDLNGKELITKFSPDGKTITTGGAYETQIWDLNGKKLTELEYFMEKDYNSILFNPNRALRATHDKEGTIHLYNLSGTEITQFKTGKKITQFKGYRKTGWDITFSPDRKLIATAGEDGMARLWDLNGKEITQLKGGHKNPVVLIQFSPDGKLIATGEEDGTVWLWNLDGKRIAQLKGYQLVLFDIGSSVVDVQFSPDGKLIAISGENGTTIWDVTGREVAKYSGKMMLDQEWQNMTLITPIPGSKNPKITLKSALPTTPSALLSLGCDRLKYYLLQSPKLKDDRKMCGLE